VVCYFVRGPQPGLVAERALLACVHTPMRGYFTHLVTPPQGIRALNLRELAKLLALGLCFIDTADSPSFNVREASILAGIGVNWSMTASIDALPTPRRT
jgi:hypothetical protein